MKSIVDLNFDWNLIPNPTTEKEKSIVEIAELIYKDYFFENTFLDTIYMGKGYFYWRYNHENSANTYQLYIHTLGVVRYLSDAYLKTQEKKYLIKAREIINSWIKYDNNKLSKKTKYVWCDHATSNRVMHIIYFYLISKSKIMLQSKKIEKVILKHINVIENCRYPKNNHGLMLDSSLLVLSYVINDKNISERIYNKGLYRIREAFYRDFSSKGVHLENSTDYHSFTKRLFIDAQRFLKNFSNGLGKDIDLFLENDSYFSYIMKPNKYLPMIGDSSKNFVRGIEKKYDNFFDLTAGVVIFQNMKNNFYLLFRCGYKKQNHKHFDDLSINLFFEEYDIFVDSGKYNYDESSKERKYFKSSDAHNTITIGKDYDIIEDSDIVTSRPHITSYQSNKVYDIVSGINYYDDGYHNRTVIYLKPNIIIILDEAEHKVEHEIIQNFNINPKLNTEIKDNVIYLKNGNKNIAKIEQKSIYDDIQIRLGNNEVPFGVVSDSFEKMEVIEQLRTKIKSSVARFTTIITLGEYIDNIEINNLNYNSKKGNITFEYEENDYCIYI